MKDEWQTSTESSYGWGNYDFEKLIDHCAGSRTALELSASLATCFHFYNRERLHQGLAYPTSAAAHFA